MCRDAVPSSGRSVFASAGTARFGRGRLDLGRRGPGGALCRSRLAVLGFHVPCCRVCWPRCVRLESGWSGSRERAFFGRGRKYPKFWPCELRAAAAVAGWRVSGGPLPGCARRWAVPRCWPLAWGLQLAAHGDGVMPLTSARGWWVFLLFTDGWRPDSSEICGE